MGAHRWDTAGVRFVFGCDASPGFVDRAENTHPEDYAELVRRANAQFAGKPRSKQPRLVCEDTAEFDYRPRKAKRTYRIVLLPAQILSSSRRLIVRLLAWRPELPVFFRLLDAF